MKKLYLLGAAVLCALTASAADIPTHPAVGSDEFAEGWTVINANDDSKTWEAVWDGDRYAYIAKIGYTMQNTNPHDDYLLSPAISMEGGKEYYLVINYKMGGYYDLDNLTVYVSKSTDVDQIKASPVILENKDTYIPVYTHEMMTFTPEESGEYYVVFYCDSEEYRSGIWLDEMIVADEMKVNPVSDLKVTPAAKRAIECTVSWTLPTTNSLGAVLTEEDGVEKVLVYRDDSTTPFECEATATSFVDTEANGLVAGVHTYTVVVVDKQGKESDKVSVESAYVGPLEPVEIPVDFSLATEADFDNWEAIKGESSTASGWKYSEYDGAAKFELGFYASDDDWLIAPPVTVEEAGYIKVTVNARMSSGSMSRFFVAMGSAPDAAQMEIVSDGFELSDSYNYSETSVVVAVETPGTYYFGLHNNLGKSNPEWGSYYYYVKGLSLEVGEYQPEKVTGLTAKGSADLSNNIVVSWTNPVETNPFVVKVYLEDSEIPFATYTDGTETCTIPVSAPGSYTVKVVTESETGATKGAAVVKSSWVGSPEVAVPYSTNFDATLDPAVEIWKSFIVDANEDGYTFKWAEKTSYTTYKMEVVEGASTYNDFLLSPYMQLNATSYRMKLDVQGGYNMPFDVVVGLVPAGQFDADEFPGNLVASKTLTMDSYSSVIKTVSLDVEAEGLYQVVISRVGAETSYYAEFQLFSFEIDEVLAYPANVTSLKVEVAPENPDYALISWVNPSKVYESEKELTEIQAVVVERDGEVIATLTKDLEPGQAASFVDETLPSGGVYTYTVYATLNGAAHDGEYASASAWVGGGVSAPLSMAADDDRWTIVDTHSDYNVSSGKYGWWYDTMSDKLIYYHDGAGNEADDYLLTPPMKVNEGEIYKVTITAAPITVKYSDEKAYTAAVKMGVEANHAELPKVYDIELTEDHERLKEYPFSFHVAVGNPTSTPAQAPKRADAIELPSDDEVAAQLYAEAVKLVGGSHRVAIHANSAGGMRVQSFSFEKVADYNGATTGLENVTAAGVVAEGSTLHFAGRATVEVYSIAGACLVSAEAENSFDLSNLANSCYIVKVTTASETTTLKVVL